MRTRSAALLASASLGLAGCAGGAGDTASLDTPSLAVARAAQSSLATTRSARAQAPRRSARNVVRRPAVPPAGSQHGKREAPTPTSPPRSRTAEPSRALPVSAAPRLASPACEQYVAAVAGRYPAPVRARGEARGLAIVTESVAAALLGMPVAAPRASLAAREELAHAHARLTRALAAGEATATAIADATGPRIRAYARVLGIDGCG